MGLYGIGLVPLVLLIAPFPTNRQNEQRISFPFPNRIECSPI